MEKECRICMMESNYETGENVLIQPCRCITSYVHESCLQQWRDENIHNNKYHQCEICQADYVFLRDHPTETFELYKMNKMVPQCCSYVVYLCIGSMACIILDTFLGQLSLTVLNGGDKNTALVISLNDNSGLNWIAYYLSYTSYIYCMVFFGLMFCGVARHVHRRQLYIEKTRLEYGILFVGSWTYFYNYYIFYKAFDSLDSYIGASLISVILNFLILQSILQIHHRTIRQLNDDNTESIISISYNPLIEITAD